MSTKSNEPKGFLGTDDLDLDAWDATFDALHAPTEGEGGGRDGGQPDEPGGSVGDVTSISADAAPLSFDDLEDGGAELDQTSVLDGGRGATAAELADDELLAGESEALPAPVDEAADYQLEAAPEVEVAAAVEDEGGTADQEIEADEPEGAVELEAEEAGDFEEVNTVELGEAAMLAEFHNFEEAARRSRRTFAPVVPRASRPSGQRHVTAPVSGSWSPTPAAAEEQDVYTSAARPETKSDLPRAVTPAPLPSRNLIGRTPTPQTVLPRTITPGQVTSTVVRRRDLRDEPSRRFDTHEPTRIADSDELEVSKSRSRASAPNLGNAPPPQEVVIPEDDYADIEIGGSEAASAGPAAPEERTPQSSPALVLPPVTPAAPGPMAGRRTAHVLRRRGPTTRPPFGESEGDRRPSQIFSAPSLERPTTPTGPRDEDDFSDVASEVLGGEPVVEERRSGSFAIEPARGAEREETAAEGFATSVRSIDVRQETVDSIDENLDASPDESPDASPDESLEEDDATQVASQVAVPVSAAPAAPPPLASLLAQRMPSRRIETTGEDDLADPPTHVAGRAAPERRAPLSTMSDDAAEEIARSLPAEDVATSLIEMSEPPPSARASASVPAVAPERSFERAGVERPADRLPIAPRGEPAAARPSERPAPSVPFAPARVKTPTSVPPFARQAAEPRPSTLGDLAFESLAVGSEPELSLESMSLPEQVAPLPASGLDESFAQTLALIEEDLELTGEREDAAMLRLEAGRLAEALGEGERARNHYESSLLADPRLAAALRGLRRLALESGDLGTATRQLDAELEVAGALERRPLGHYRADLLMAAAEQDLARVAVGEMLDAAPSDVRALIAQLELAYLDGRHDELGASLAQLANAVSDVGLRAAADTARAVLGTRPEVATANVGQIFLSAAAIDPSSTMWRLAAARHLVLDDADASLGADAMTQVAFQIALGDKDVAAALAVRALLWGAPDGAVELAASAAPADPIVAQTMVEAASPSAAAKALSRCADAAPSLARRSYLAGLAAEIDVANAASHWAHVLEADPGDDYAAAQLRTSHVASDSASAAIDVDLAASQDESRERSRLRAGFGLAGLGQLDRAIEVLREGRRLRPGSLPISEALAEVYAQASMWQERAELFAELVVGGHDNLDPELAAMRSALAWEDAATAAADVDSTPARRKAAAAWESVLEIAASSPVASGALIGLARQLDDAELLRGALARAHAVERTPWMSSSMALRRARHAAIPDEADSLLRDAATLGVDDPRRLVMASWYAAQRGDLDDVATSLDDRARYLEELDASHTAEAASLRLRAAQLAFEANDPGRAAALLAAVGEALPTLSVVPDLLASARRRAGDQPVVTSAVRRAVPTASGDEFARWVREADYLATQGDAPAAIALYQRALDLHPQDPLAAVPLRRVAAAASEPAPVAALALAQLRHAESSDDRRRVADAYEVLADLDLTVRRDEGAATIALESAIKADPRRLVALRQLGRLYAGKGQVSDLLRLRKLELEQVASVPPDRAALLFDVAELAERDGRPDDELAESLTAALAIEPRQRLGLFQLEALVRRKGPSAALAELEEQISCYFDDDGPAAAAFLTRAGETFAEIGDIEAAIARFKVAVEACEGHIPALRGWRLAALKGQLWLDVAESASREAAATDDAGGRAALYHLAGVALMDKALVAERALGPLSQALTAEPGHRDAFLRLRILLEEDARHEDLASLLERRLLVETEATAKIELHRAIADLHRNFLSDREEAKRHYRSILELDGDDLRAHGALSDIAWEQGEWGEAAAALQARARLEREPSVLRTLYYRLGLIYADRLPDVPAAIGWLQKALQYDPDDDAALVRLADLAAGAKEWKLALSACDRLVKNETDPDRRVAHLHRVARIFVDGLGDRKRAERALNLALDGAPTNEVARAELVRFYRAGNDATSIRIHLTRVAGAMRTRIDGNPRDAEAYQVLSRTMTDRAAAAAPGSTAVARVAAELALLTGGGGDAERRLRDSEPAPRLAALLSPDADDLLFPRTVAGELRQMFHLLGDRLAKHVGVDLRVYGATRGERLRPKDSAVARVAQEVATGLGFGEIDVYVAPRMPWVYVTEPTSPVSLILGKELAAGSEARIRFAAAAALKLASSSLSIAARLPAEELGVLVVALLRLFHPEFNAPSVDGSAVAAQVQKLRRLIPTSLVNELRPYALAIDGSRLDPVALSADLRSAGLRAGLVATQSLVPALELVAAGGDPTAALTDRTIADLLKFGLGEDMVALSR